LGGFNFHPKSGLCPFRALRETRFYRAFSDSGEIIASHEVDARDAPAVGGAWEGFLQHQRVPFISYPYEWTFTMPMAGANDGLSPGGPSFCWPCTHYAMPSRELKQCIHPHP
jgi:hypothetical protein